MPRRAPPRGPGARADGQPQAGNLDVAGAGQPNGLPPSGAVPVAAGAAGAGAPMGYGQAGDLAGAAGATAPPAGVSPEAHSAMLALTQHLKNRAAMGRPVVPLFSPTQRPTEPVTAGAPMGPGPTNPMALAGMNSGPDQGQDIADILQQAANATGSATLRALAERAAAAAASPAATGP